MNVFSPKERLIRVLNKQKVERPPVICPGGMMNAAVVDVMEKTGHVLPEAHHEGVLMSYLADDIHKYTGFENFGIPFCLTVEAEVLGSSIDFGSLSCEPKIAKEVYPSVSAVEYKGLNEMSKAKRVNSILQAIYMLSGKNPDVPVIGNITGPISTAASIVDPMVFLRELRKDSENSHRVLDYVSNHLIELAKLIVENGASVISIGDPTATGEILGPKSFKEYAVRYINKVTESINALGVPVIVHICGKMNAVKNLIPEINTNAISTDALVNLKALKEDYPQLTTMGNLSTYLLEFGNPRKVSEHTEKLLLDDIDIISPACGLSTSSSIENIQAMTKTVKEN